MVSIPLLCICLNNKASVFKYIYLVCLIDTFRTTSEVKLKLTEASSFEQLYDYACHVV